MKKREIDLENDFTEVEEEVFKVDNKKDQVEAGGKLEDIIAKKYKLGMNVREIYRNHNVSIGQIYDILRRKHVPLRHTVTNSRSAQRVKNMSQEEIECLVNDYVSNRLTLEEIYKKYNINKHGCYMILDEVGVPRKGLNATTGSCMYSIMSDNNGEEGQPVTSNPKVDHMTITDGTLTINIDCQKSEVERVNLSINLT
ncbi:DNA binding protein [Bacillus phage Shbh1]|uniref:Uncharacterized protein n=1 Tax=Bacillus phage Shbh1 TaxID=1796992 RepID=A0A142F128_9CAUD|nr:DNA binding protein [Bacillus phage Shbh1]AMQ66485.1 hypothetical protein [Bacillus phage Shbh1]